MHLLCGAPDMNAIAMMTSYPKSVSSSEGEQVRAVEMKIEHLEQQLEFLQKRVRVLMDLNGVSDEDII